MNTKGTLKMTALFRARALLLATLVLSSVVAIEKSNETLSRVHHGNDKMTTTSRAAINKDSAGDKHDTNKSVVTEGAKTRPKYGTENQSEPAWYMRMFTAVYDYFMTFFLQEKLSESPRANSSIDDSVKLKASEGNKLVGDKKGEESRCQSCEEKRISKPVLRSEETVIAHRIQQVADLLREKLGSPSDGQAKTLDATKSSLSDLPPNLVKELLSQDNKEDKEEEDDFFAWDKRRIIIGENTTQECEHMPRARCYNFQLEDKITATVLSARLWIHKSLCGNETRGFVVTVHQMSSLTSERIAQQRTASGQDWLLLNVTHSVLGWVKHGQGKVSLAIRCIGFYKSFRPNLKTKPNHKPLLAVDFAHKHQNRLRRSSSSCDRRYQCCKVNLTVPTSYFDALNFTFINPYLTINYCYGNCKINGNYFTNHTIYKHYTYHNYPEEQLENPVPFCCVPKTLKAASVLYRKNDMPEIHQLLANVQVDTCGCL